MTNTTNTTKSTKETAIKYTMPKSVSSLNAMIDKAIDSANTMQARVQQAAVAILFHANKHGDYTAANRLVLGLGQGVKTAALVEWFIKFGGLVVDADDASSGFTGWSGADYIKDNFTGAKSTMWWTFKQASPFAGFDVASDAQKLRDKAQKMYNAKLKAEQVGDKEKADKILVTVEQIRALDALLAAMGAPSVADK